MYSICLAEFVLASMSYIRTHVVRLHALHLSRAFYILRVKYGKEWIENEGKMNLFLIIINKK